MSAVKIIEDYLGSDLGLIAFRRELGFGKMQEGLFFEPSDSLTASPEPMFQRASDFTRFDQHLLKTRIVSKLYDIRKNIVHSYLEGLEALASNARLLFDLATILYASYFGLGYSHEGAVADSMQADR